jgi:hypothetical protein
MHSTRFAVVLLAAVSVVSGAQEPRPLIQPDSVPLDLATALIGAGGLGGDMQMPHRVGAWCSVLGARQ